MKVKFIGRALVCYYGEAELTIGKIYKVQEWDSNIKFPAFKIFDDRHFLMWEEKRFFKQIKKRMQRK